MSQIENPFQERPEAVADRVDQRLELARQPLDPGVAATLERHQPVGGPEVLMISHETPRVVTGQGGLAVPRTAHTIAQDRLLLHDHELWADLVARQTGENEPHEHIANTGDDLRRWLPREVITR